MRSRRLSAGLLACALILAAPAAWGASAMPRAPTPKETAAWKGLVAEAEAARAKGDWKGLERASRRRAAIEERTFGPDAPVTAASYSWIGQALSRQGRDADAEPFFRRAYGIDRKALGERHSETLLASNNLAALLERRGRFADAEPLRQALLTASRGAFGDRSAEAAAAGVALADVLRAQARPAEAEPLYRAAVEADRRLLPEKDPRLASDLGALGATLDDLGRHAEAEPLHRRALALRRAAFGEHDAATAQAYARMAANLDAQGRHAEAEPLFRAALATDRDVRGEVHAATAADAAALGANLDAQGRSGEAEPLLRQALAVRRKVLGEAHPDTGLSYGALAANLAARGQRAEAERLHRRALAILTAARGVADPTTATAQLALAGDLAARGKAVEAEPLLEDALAVRRAALGEHHPATAEAYAALADNAHSLASPTRAEALASRAIAIVRARQAAELKAQGPTPDAAIRRARALTDVGRAPIFSRYLGLAWAAAQAGPAETPRLRDAAFTAAQDVEVSPAARALAQTAARDAAGASAGEARVQQELSRDAGRIEGQLVKALPADDLKAARIGAALDAVAAELAGLDARLSRGAPLYDQLMAPAPLSIAEVQKRLHVGEGLLVLVPAGDDVHVFAISRSHVAWNRLDGRLPDLVRRLTALRCEVDDAACHGHAMSLGLPAYDLATAYGVYRDIIAPVEGALAGVDRLFVTAGGPLGGLPLGLLPTAAPAGPAPLANTSWLADRYALTTLPSVASLRVAPPGRRAGVKRAAFVGYGDPDLAGASYPSTPGTAVELRAMAKALGAPPSTVRLGRAATETAIRTAPDLAKAAVVAFATHSLSSGEIPHLDEPALIFTASKKDDGVLTASEAAGLNLSADWVILSACNTAGPDGQPGADNLSGLARAFLSAGARALLVSHWRVFDDSTAALTVQTLAFQRAHPQLTKAQALQAAMHEVRTGKRPDGSPLPGWHPEWAHPAYWAPFVLISAGG